MGHRDMLQGRDLDETRVVPLYLALVEGHHSPYLFLFLVQIAAEYVVSQVKEPWHRVGIRLEWLAREALSRKGEGCLLFHTIGVLVDLRM